MEVNPSHPETRLVADVDGLSPEGFEERVLNLAELVPDGFGVETALTGRGVRDSELD